MKKIVLILIAALPVALFAQTADNFTIKAKAGQFNPPARAYLIYTVAQKNVIDSAVIHNGEFSFHGNISGPVSALLVIDPKAVGLTKLTRSADILNFYLEKSNLLITGTDSIAKAKITGGKVNDDNDKLKELLAPVEAKTKALMAEATNAPDAQKINPAFQNGVAQKYKVIQFEQENILKRFITDNPQSYVSLVALSSISGPQSDAAEIEKMLVALSPDVRSTEAGVALRQQLDDLKATAIGSLAPDFTQADTSGKPLKLSSFRGKYVLVDFWASWCGPCRQENPNVVSAYQHYKTKNFTIIGVSLDKPTDKAAWLKAIKDDGLAWNQVSDLKYWNNEAARLYNISSIPQNFLIDPTGKIIAKNLRGAELASTLAGIFKM